MRLIIFSSLLAAIAPVPVVFAQSPVENAKPVPQQTGATLYESAFSDYKPYKEPTVMSWRQANDQVRETGGMAGHDMSAMGAKSGHGNAGHGGGATPSTGTSAGDPHAGHNMTGTSMAAGKPARNATSGAGHQGHETHSASPEAANSTSEKLAKTADPHAGHDMGAMPSNAMPAAQTDKMKPKPAAGQGRSATASKKPASPKKAGAVKQSGAGSNTPSPRAREPAAAPHAGHDMGAATPKRSIPEAAKPAVTQKDTSAGHAGHTSGSTPAGSDNAKKNKEQK